MVAHLCDEIRERRWFYRHRLPDGTTTDSYLPPDAQPIHESRLHMLVAHVEERYGTDWSALRCLDLGCHEGFFSMELARRGCSHVLGIDARRENLENAELIRRAYGLDNVELRQGDLRELNARELGRFDVVLLFGVLYHVDDPIGVLRTARDLTAGVCVIETQIAPELEGVLEWGSADYAMPIRGALAIVDEAAEIEHGNREAGVSGLALVPSLGGLLTLLRAVGFDAVQVLEPPPGAYEQLGRRRRVMVSARSLGHRTGHSEHGVTAVSNPSRSAERPSATKGRAVRHVEGTQGTALENDKEDSLRQVRLEEEIARYRDCCNVHDLPAIHDWWSARYVLPKLRACGLSSLDDFFLHHILEANRRTAPRELRIVSLGAGNCDLEVRLAKLAQERNLDRPQFLCVELNPEMVARGRRLAEREGVSDRFSFEIADLEEWEPTAAPAVFIANHSLHHLVGLERLFAIVEHSLDADGVFLVNDMIGRNGHRRWPEALEQVIRLWRDLPLHQRYNHQLRRVEHEFVDWDCSQEGNEGIRAQDVLPLLIEHFHFETFVAFGNVIDVFVDRCFGQNFDPENPDDVARIDRIARLDETLLDSGVVKPTHLIGALRTRPVSLRCYRHWTPGFCVRHPSNLP